jgi:hypothetical protein
MHSVIFFVISLYLIEIQKLFFLSIVFCHFDLILLRFLFRGLVRIGFIRRCFNFFMFLFFFIRIKKLLNTLFVLIFGFTIIPQIIKWVFCWIHEILWGLSKNLAFDITLFNLINWLFYLLDIILFILLFHLI